MYILVVKFVLDEEILKLYYYCKSNSFYFKYSSFQFDY